MPEGRITTQERWFYPLVPPELVPDIVAPQSLRKMDPNWDDSLVGPKARALTSRIISSCAGWPKWPTSEELFDAFHAEEPTDRQKALIGMWVSEATDNELMDAWIQEVYTLRELVAAMHRIDYTWLYERNEWIRYWLSEAPPWND